AASTVWAVRRTLPDFRWSRKVIEYETAYLWLFCAYNGTLITSFFKLDDLWSIVDRSLFRGIFIMDVRPGLIIYGNAALILLWLWRYRIITRAIRWSNF
ncbi:MAG: hypothetical protein V3T70_03790, partial [Phycisphaerae bacterium]